MPEFVSSLYVPGKNIQEVLIDHATGLPMYGGTLKFWADNARTIPKVVYQESGDPDEPYVPLGSVITLGTAGTPVDINGNDVAIFYKIFDDDGQKSLYFLDAYNADGAWRLSRNNWPFDFDISQNAEFNFIENYAPNGQFSIHTNVGELTEQFTNIALGGWAAILPEGFTSVNTVTFERFDDYITNPAGNPRYAQRWVTSSPNPAEGRKDIALIFKDVNTFSNMIITCQFAAKTDIGVPVNIDLIIEKIFGAGGSATTETYITTFTIQPTVYDEYTFSFTMGDNSGKSIGDGDDDQVRFLLRLPSNIANNFLVTDYMVVPGAYPRLTYQQVTSQQYSSQVLGGSIETPAVDGSDEGKTLVLGKSNISQLAALIWKKIFPTGFTWWTPTVVSDDFLDAENWLYMNGQTCDIVGEGTEKFIDLANWLGTYNGIGADSFYTSNPSSTKVDYQSRDVGSCTTPNMYSSGFSYSITTAGNATTQQTVEITTIAASLIPPGSYFRIYAPTARSTIYWFSIDGVGTDPSGSFGSQLVKEIALASTDTASQVAVKLAAGWQTQMAIPDMRNMLPKGFNDGRFDIFFDPDSATRILPHSLTLSGTTSIWNGGSTTHTFTATGVRSTFTLAGKIATSTNPAKILEIYYASDDNITVVFNVDPGVGTTITWTGTDMSAQVVGDVPGSEQMDAYQDHKHAPLNPYTGYVMHGAGGAQVDSSTNNDFVASTGLSLSGQGFRASSVTRDKSIAGTWLIKL